MAEVTTYPPGAFCWIELATTDGGAAKQFYSGLFGWKTEDSPIGPDMVYTMLRIGSMDVGALYQMTKADIARGGFPKWLSYVSVPNADDTANRARSLGAKVLKEPMDVFDVGRMALIQDPEGALLALWQPRLHIGAKVVNQPGALCWNELATRDTAKATGFYTSLFGWTPKVLGAGPDAYTELLNGIVPVGGILEIKKEWGEIPPHWLVYIAIEDCNAGVEKARALGGRVEHGPIDIPNVGRFAVIADPQGAVFAVIQMANPNL